MELPDHPVPLKEYLRLDAISPEPLEYINGYVIALKVASMYHSKIIRNLTRKLDKPLEAAEHDGCDFFTRDAKVLTPDGDRLIPDVAVNCDPRDQLKHAGENIIQHPWLIIEVQSPTREAYDATGKFDLYKTIKELTHYVVINSRWQNMHLYQRLSDGDFKISPPLERLVLPIVCEDGMSLAEVYRRTTVPRIDGVRGLRI